MNFIKPASLFLISLALTACTDDNYDLIQYIHSIKRRVSPPIEAIPNFAPLPVFKFPEESNRRNPFKPTSVKKQTIDPYAPDQKRIKEPLESYPLDALQFVGILKQGADVWGLIKQPNGQIVRVKVGNYMGQNYGQIKSIKTNVIQLDETVRGSSGKWEKQITSLELFSGK